MKRILATTTLALSIGVASTALFAQTQLQQAPESSASGSVEPKLETGKAAGQAGADASAMSGVKLKADGTSSAQTGSSTMPGKAAGPEQSGSEQQAADDKGQRLDAQTDADADTASPAQAQGETAGTDATTTAALPEVTTEQRTEITEVIRETQVEPAEIDIDLSVGVAVPRTVELHPLPPRIVEIVPAYEGYRYFVLADGRIIIVEPATFEVVYIIAA